MLKTSFRYDIIKGQSAPKSTLSRVVYFNGCYMLDLTNAQAGRSAYVSKGTEIDEQTLIRSLSRSFKRRVSPLEVKELRKSLMKKS
jgi:predicted RNA-binding protein YlxR (DUF448 family)